jgi:hypothetical protein
MSEGMSNMMNVSALASKKPLVTEIDGIACVSTCSDKPTPDGTTSSKKWCY